MSQPTANHTKRKKQQEEVKCGPLDRFFKSKSSQNSQSQEKGSSVTSNISSQEKENQMVIEPTSLKIINIQRQQDSFGRCNLVQLNNLMEEEEEENKSEFVVENELNENKIENHNSQKQNSQSKQEQSNKTENSASLNKKRSNMMIQKLNTSPSPNKKSKNDTLSKDQKSKQINQKLVDSDISNKYICNIFDNWDNKSDQKKQSRNMLSQPFLSSVMKSKDAYRLFKFKTQWDKEVELRPSEQQLDVIVSDIHKDTKIIACAGSGKTTTVVMRLKYLLDHGVRAKEIMVSTFNIEAGKHLRQKVNEIIGKIGTKLIKISNIDKIAFGLIKNELQVKENHSKQVVKFSQREHCVMWLDHIKRNPHIYKDIKYFFFDEFQDISEWQYQVLMEFKKLGSILTVIGDDAQNIYAFRDTKIDIIQNRIDKDLKAMELDLQVFNLTINYRSTHAITQFANQIIQNSKNLIQKIMQSAQQMLKESKKEKDTEQMDMNENDEELPVMHIYYNPVKQYDGIIDSIIYKVNNQECKFKDIAILAPTNQLLKNIEERIESYNNKNNYRQEYQIPYISLITGKRSKSSNQKSTQQGSDKITLTTIHKSKGLEWDIVYYLGCRDDIFPVKFVCQSKNPNETLEEQRRLFYVGTTRAGKELNFYCVSKKKGCFSAEDTQQGNYKVSRFFAEIPMALYKAEDLKEYMITEYQKIEYTGSKGVELLPIAEVIDEMTPHELKDINQYLQNIEKDENYNIYQQDFIESKSKFQFSLINEIGSFYYQYIMRMIGEKYNGINAYYDDEAVQVILPQIHVLKLPLNILKNYLKYQPSLKSLDFQQFNDIDSMIQYIQNTEQQYNNIADIENIKELFRLLQKNTQREFVQLEQLFQDEMLVSEFLQVHEGNLDFSEKFIKALNTYINKYQKTENIFNHIHQISKCQFLLDGRKKYLHDDNHQKLMNNELLQQINDHFLSKYLSDFKEFECKRIYKTNHITGFIDLIVNQNQLIFFNTDLKNSFDKEDLLNYTFAAATLQLDCKMDIKKIVIFNFFTGQLYSIDLTKWQTQKEYIRQMEFIAQQINKKRNKAWMANQDNKTGNDEKQIEEQNNNKLNTVLPSLTSSPDNQNNNNCFSIFQTQTNHQSFDEQRLIQQETEDAT